MTDDPGRIVPPHGSGPTDVIRPKMEALREASEGATKGPWAVDAAEFPGEFGRQGGDPMFLGTLFSSDTAQNIADAAFIAASANFTRAVLDRDPATLRAILADAPVEMLAGALEARMDDVPMLTADRAESAAQGATPMDPWEETNYHAVVSAYLRALAGPGEG